MSLEQYAYLAEIIGVVAVIASLLFLAFEVRRNSMQARLSNWESVIDRFNALWSRTNDPVLADVVVRGRADLSNLSESERLTFGHYYEELAITYESMAIGGDHPKADRILMVELATKHLKFHFGFPGAQEWWTEWKRNAGPPPQMRALVDFAIDAEVS